MTWDPARYERFCDQRRRPAEELMHAALATLHGPPRRVVDLGCGAGELARRLADKLPQATVTGIDSSAAMLERALATPSRVTWTEADIAQWQPQEPQDLIVSNAALHWLPDHQTLFPHLMTALAPEGVLAVQMPRNFDAPSHRLLRETAAEGPWARALEGVLPVAPVHDPEAYYDWLAPHAASLNLWQTSYLHVLPGEDAVLEWTKGTAVRPVLARLDETQAAAFLAVYGAKLRAAYPRRAEGHTLFPFRRLFLVARR